MIKKILLVLLVVFVVMQFFQPKKNISETTPKSDFIVNLTPPADVANMLKTSCYDCHSNNTNYPWYGYIAPVSYYLNDHVEDGKKHLNFSDWTTYSDKRKDHKLEEIAEEVAEGKMPLESYLNIHKEAELTQNQVDALVEWVAMTRSMNALQVGQPQ